MLPPPPIPQTAVEKALAKLTIPLKIFKHTTKINLPTDIDSVTMTWEANVEGYNANIIVTGNTAQIYHPNSGTAAFTLTATATKDGETKTRAFKGTLYAKTFIPSAQDLADELMIDTEFSKDRVLPSRIEGYHASMLTWTSEDEKIIKTELEGSAENPTGYKCIITPDIIDQKTTLRVKINHADASPDTPNEINKEFSVTVKHAAQIIQDNTKYVFSGKELTVTNPAEGTVTRGAKYTYANVTAESDYVEIRRTASFTQTAAWEGGNWVTKENQPANDYKYTIKKTGENLKFITNALFREGTAWYEQMGIYGYTPSGPSTDPITGIVLSFENTSGIVINILIEKDGKQYKGSAAPGQTEIESVKLKKDGTDESDYLTVTMTDLDAVPDNGGSLTITNFTVTDSSNSPVETPAAVLSFLGLPLFK